METGVRVIGIEYNFKDSLDIGLISVMLLPVVTPHVYE